MAETGPSGRRTLVREMLSSLRLQRQRRLRMSESCNRLHHPRLRLRRPRIPEGRAGSCQR